MGKVNWQYVTFDHDLPLDIEPGFGDLTTVRVEVEYDPLEMEPNEVTCYIPCRHDPKCREHILIVDRLVIGEMRDGIYPVIYRKIREHREAVLADRRALV